MGWTWSIHAWSPLTGDSKSITQKSVPRTNPSCLGIWVIEQTLVFYFWVYNHTHLERRPVEAKFFQGDMTKTSLEKQFKVTSSSSSAWGNLNSSWRQSSFMIRVLVIITLEFGLLNYFSYSSFLDNNNNNKTPATLVSFNLKTLIHTDWGRSWLVHAGPQSQVRGN